MDQRNNQGDASTGRELLRNLVRELFQAERSAQRHCRVEARRLGDTPPAQTLMSVAQHADAALEQLPGLTRHLGLRFSASGLAAGSLLSNFRERLLDALISLEKSYRGTLLGVRHGVDLVTLLRDAARGVGEDEFMQWCERWLEQRSQRVEAMVEHLAWFAANPGQALKPAEDTPLGRGLHALTTGPSRIDRMMGTQN